ncbi:hypothetical protein D4R89_12955 [bacterium]|nr:MAG: hypothetical protein D4R89_12955 [bacterium]
MGFQTVFFLRSSGQIINVIPDKYVRSKAERTRLCPDFPPDDVSFRYFKSDIPVDPGAHRAVFSDPAHPPVIAVQSGVPLTLAFWRDPFLEAKAKFKTIIVDMCDGLGDNLFRAASVSAAARKYPELRFFCKVDPLYRPVMAMCPEIVLFDSYEAHGLDPAQCGTIKLNGGHLWDARGAGFSKSAHYGLFFDLPHVVYNTRLELPPDFAEGFSGFIKKYHLKKEGQYVVLQLRTKDTSDRGWSIANVLELARMIRAEKELSILFLGDPMDMPEDNPNIVNLCGKTTWLETVYLLTLASKIICIDSAVMHLCRALSLPYFCLWGHTDPLRTLGVPAGPQDIGSNYGTPLSLMSSITPLHVFNRTFTGKSE